MVRQPQRLTVEWGGRISRAMSESNRVRTECMLALLGAERAELARRFSVRRIGLFGSWSRNEARPDSDVDLLVEFDEPTFDHFMDLKFHLEKLLGSKVDLVTPQALRSPLRELILRETRYAA